MDGGGNGVATRLGLSADPVPTLLTWGFACGATHLPTILTREFGGSEPAWLVPLQLIFIVGLLAGSVLRPRLRPLRAFALVLLVVQAQFLLDWAVVDSVLRTGVTGGLWAWAADRTLSFGLAGALLAVLLVLGHSRADLFLTWGSLAARFDPIPIPGLRTARPWRWYARRWGGGILLGTVIVALLQAGSPWLAGLSPDRLIVVLPVILLMAGLNAFSEEFLFRAAPLQDLVGLLGKHHALVLLGVVFGVSHYYGTPSGPLAVVMGIALGWFLGKSMLETGGLGFAWVLHVLLDIVVFSVY